MEFRIFGITFRGSWCLFGDDPSAQGPATPPVLQPIPVPFMVARTGSAEAQEILMGQSFTALKAAYVQSLAIARQMLRDGMHHQDARPCASDWISSGRSSPSTVFRRITSERFCQACSPAAVHWMRAIPTRFFRPSRKRRTVAMITTDLTPRQITIIGLNLVTGGLTAHFSPRHGDDWLIIARAIEAAYLDGERLHLGCLSGHVLDIEDSQQCQADQPGAYTVFGFDHAAGEALVIQVIATTAADAVNQAFLSQPDSFQAAGVAAGFHEWAPGSTWQTLAAPVLSCA